MSAAHETGTDTTTPRAIQTTQRAIEVAIRLSLVGLLVLWCYTILRPFLVPVLWGGIIAIGLQPLFQRGERMLGGRAKTTAALFGLVGLAALLVPSVLLAGSAFDGVTSIKAGLEAGTLEVPPPPDRVAEWPVIGAQVHAAWAQASHSLEDALARAAPHLGGLFSGIFSTVAGVGMGILGFAISIVIACVFLVQAQGMRRSFDRLAERLVPGRGHDLIELARATVNSVVQGVLGVAVIQSLMAGTGMLVAGVPGAGLWAIGVLVLAVAQLPPLLVLGPVAIYVFSVDTTTTAVLFLVWSLVVSFSDSFLKPLLLGRGVDVPMLVILLGAIGGMIVYGIIGLFIGATVLALAYKLFVAWIQLELPPEEGEAAPG